MDDLREFEIGWIIYKNIAYQRTLQVINSSSLGENIHLRKVGCTRRLYEPNPYTLFGKELFKIRRKRLEAESLLHN